MKRFGPIIRATFLATTVILVLVAVSWELRASDKATQALRFNGIDYVELKDTKGLLDLNAGSFTVEAWVRWDPKMIGRHNLIGDDAWPGLSTELPVDKPVGWVLRTGPIDDVNKRFIEFNVSATVQGKTDWWTVQTPLRRDVDPTWQHIAVCKTIDQITIYWNGKIAARRDCRGVRFNPAPTDLYLGVRKHANKEVKQLRADFKALRVSNLARYKKDFKPDEVLAKDGATLILLEFVGGDPEKVNDGSGKNHQGMIGGAKWIEIE